MTNPHFVTIDGVVYTRELARVEEPVKMLDNDHGGVHILVGFLLDGGSSHQQYAPSFSLKRRDALACATHFYWSLRRYPEGWTGYVLRVHREGCSMHGEFICGIEDPFGKHETWITQREIDRVRALEP